MLSNTFFLDIFSLKIRLDLDNGFEFSKDVSANDLEPSEGWNLNMGIRV